MTLGDIISQYTKTHSMNDFLKDSGLSKTYTYMLIKNKNSKGMPITPSLDTIKKVANGVHSSFDKVFNLLDDDIVVHYGNYSSIPDEFVTLYNMLPIESKEHVQQTVRDEYEKYKDVIERYYKIKSMDKITDYDDAKFLVDYSIQFGDSDQDQIIIELANSLSKKHFNK